jgi:hypothetical protein
MGRGQTPSAADLLTGRSIRPAGGPAPHRGPSLPKETRALLAGDKSLILSYPADDVEMASWYRDQIAARCSAARSTGQSGILVIAALGADAWRKRLSEAKILSPSELFIERSYGKLLIQHCELVIADNPLGTRVRSRAAAITREAEARLIVITSPNPETRAEQERHFADLKPALLERE